MRSLVDDWNSCLDHMVEKVKAWNATLLQKFTDGLVTPEHVMNGLEPIPQGLRYPSEHWCRDFKLNYGWSMLTRGSSEAQWLGYCHPDMQSSRDDFQEAMKSCHGALCLNFDQVWRNSWNTSAFKMFHKSCDAIGIRGRRKTPGRREDKKVHHVKGSRKAMTVSWCCCVEQLSSPKENVDKQTWNI